MSNLVTLLICLHFIGARIIVSATREWAADIPQYFKENARNLAFLHTYLPMTILLIDILLSTNSNFSFSLKKSVKYDKNKNKIFLGIVAAPGSGGAVVGSGKFFQPSPTNFVSFITVVISNLSLLLGLRGQVRGSGRCRFLGLGTRLLRCAKSCSRSTS